jgi:hypothetical protein
MTTFEKSAEQYTEQWITDIIKQRFETAGMRWETEFTIDSFVELICVLNNHAANRRYRAAEINCIKPVI